LRSVTDSGRDLVITDRGRPVARLVPERSAPVVRAPMRIRRAVADLSDLRWLRERLPRDEPATTDADLRDMLELTRAEKAVE
jgi:antitoxin (DNA-binding transcriptional repressor) of toxin-antitoxin stability system